MHPSNYGRARNYCGCLGAVTLVAAAALIIPGALGVHKVIPLVKGGQGALLGVGALVGVVAATAFYGTYFYHNRKE